MIIVAFGHESRVGKDTSAKFLDTALRMAGIRVKKVSFAAKLKDISYQVYGWAGLKPGNFYETEEGAKQRDVKLPVIDKTPVEIWIEVGNKFREVYENTWRDTVLNADYNGVQVLIITDLRFPNEGDGVHEKGGCCVRVINDRVPKRNSVSDRALDGWKGWDKLLNNDWGLKELSEMIDELAQELISKINGAE